MDFSKEKIRQTLANAPLNWQKNAKIDGEVTFTNGRTSGFVSGSSIDYHYTETLETILRYIESKKNQTPMKLRFDEESIVKEFKIKEHVGPLATVLPEGTY